MKSGAAWRQKNGVGERAVEAAAGARGTGQGDAERDHLGKLISPSCKCQTVDQIEGPSG